MQLEAVEIVLLVVLGLFVATVLGVFGFWRYRAGTQTGGDSTRACDTGASTLARVDTIHGYT